MNYTMYTFYTVHTTQYTYYTLHITHASACLWGIIQFQIRNPSKILLEQFPTKIEIDLNSLYNIPLKINRTKKKVHKKNEIAFKFTKKNPLKCIRKKKLT